MLIEMELREIQISEAGSYQIVILGEKEGTRAFPIYIGFFEAAAMDQTVRGIQTPRPMTHDLILNVIDGVGATLKRILVDQLMDDTFHGKLVVETSDGREVLIDTRPSDALVLAAKREAPIFVDEEVLEEVLSHQSENDLADSAQNEPETDDSDSEQEDPGENLF